MSKSPNDWISTTSLKQQTIRWREFVSGAHPASPILNLLGNLMKNSNPLKFPTKLPATLAIVTLGVTCFLDTAQTNAQAPHQLAPRVGEIEAERIYRPTRPTSEKLTSIGSEFAKPKIEPKSAGPRSKNQFSLIKTPAPQTPTERLAAAKQRLASAQKRMALNPIPPIKKAASTAQPKMDAVGTIKKPTDSPLKKPFAVATGSKRQQPPTVVVRPSVADPNHLNECVVEINEIKSTNDVSLKVAIPDSVTMIEVVPNRSTGSTRSFRIKMEQGAQLEPEFPQPAPVDQQAQSQTVAQVQKEAQNQFVPKAPPTQQAQKPSRAPVPKGPPSVPSEKLSQKPQTSYSNQFVVKKKVAKAAAEPIKQIEQSNPIEQIKQIKRIEQSNPIKPIETIQQIETRTESSNHEVKSFPQQPYRNDGVGVRDFFRRTSHSTLAETPQPEQLQELSFEPEPKSAKFAHSFLPTKQVIAAQILGPASINIGQTEDYMVAIVNPMDSPNRNLRIELDVPKGLEIVLLDRPAEFNKRKRTLTWDINEIQPGEEVRLQYRVKSVRKGKQLQRIAVRSNDELLETHQIYTQSNLNLDVGATTLPFE